ncbi:Uncharacterised protein [Vibrio cholerae]|nr:Uncharacterised protein [Vibrio cholerae]
MRAFLLIDHFKNFRTLLERFLTKLRITFESGANFLLQITF